MDLRNPLKKKNFDSKKIFFFLIGIRDEKTSNIFYLSIKEIQFLKEMRAEIIDGLPEGSTKKDFCFLVIL